MELIQYSKPNKENNRAYALIIYNKTKTKNQNNKGENKNVNFNRQTN